MSPEVICGGLTFENTPLELRERVAFLPSHWPSALDALRNDLGLQEGVLISTCNRVEYFGVTPAPHRAAESWIGFLRRFHLLDENFNVPAFHLQGPACVEHLYQVASGLKSMVVGETEILGQIKSAYQLAQQQGATGKWLNRLFQSSFAAAKDIRTHTAITRGSVSVGSVAAELAGKIFGDLEGRSVMVIGAGDTSEKTARALLSRGVKSIFVSNRTFERAENLAKELQGRAVHWDAWESEAGNVDIIISSTSAPHFVLTKSKVETMLQTRQPRPLFLIDLAVPRDLDPEINQLDDVYLYDIDDLQSIAAKHLSERQAEISRSVELLQPHVARFCAWAGSQDQINRPVSDTNRFQVA